MFKNPQKTGFVSRIPIRLFVFLVLMLSALSLGEVMAQGSRLVTGQVLAASDRSPIPGVNVIVKGTTRGTITDMNGNYNVEVSDSDALVFSFIGFVSQEIATAGKQVINIVMSEEVSDLEELVFA